MPNPDNPQAFNRYSYCLNNPLRYVDPTGHDPNDFYVFVQGGDFNKEWWDAFVNWLGIQWGYNIESKEWSDWKEAHVGYTNYATTGKAGEFAQDLSRWLQNDAKIQKWADKFPGGGIHLIGHSMGGAVVMEYLVGLKTGTSGISAPQQGIKSASILDAPLETPESLVGFQRYEAREERKGELPEMVYYDRLTSLGTWAKDQKITVVTVSYSESFCNHSQIDTIPHWSIPGGPGRPSRWDPRGAHAYVVEKPGGSGSFQFLWDHNALR